MKPDDDDLGGRIGKLLDQRTHELGAGTLERLSDARRRALDRLPEAAGAHRHGMLAIAAARPVWLALMILALAAGAGLTHYWNELQQIQELEAIDSALLADDLPPNAFIDPGFRKWLERASTDSAPL